MALFSIEAVFPLASIFLPSLDCRLHAVRRAVEKRLPFDNFASNPHVTLGKVTLSQFSCFLLNSSIRSTIHPLVYCILSTLACFIGVPIWNVQLTPHSPSCHRHEKHPS